MKQCKFLLLVMLIVLATEGCVAGDGKDSIQQKISEEAIIQ